MDNIIPFEDAKEGKRRYKEILKALWSTLGDWEIEILSHAVSLAEITNKKTLPHKEWTEDNWNEVEEFLDASQDQNVDSIMTLREMVLDVLSELEDQLDGELP